MTLIDHKCVALDTMVFIYLFEHHPQYVQRVRQLFADIGRYHIAMTCSTIILTELLQYPLRTHNNDLVNMYQQTLLTESSITFIPVTIPVATQAAQLAARYGLKTPDAIHLACALAGKATAFITADKRLSKVKELDIITLYA